LAANFCIDNVFLCTWHSDGDRLSPTSRKEHGWMRALLNITGMTLPFLLGSFLLLQAFGIALAFIAEWWKQAWPWISFVLLNGMTVWMTLYGRQIYSPLGMAYMTGFSKENKPEIPASMEEIQAFIEKSNPRMLTWVGCIITGLVLWLMIFKPV
jgi:hypothetical protein